MPQYWPKVRVTFADPCYVQFFSLPAKGLQHYFPEAFLSSFFATPCQVMLLLAECISPFLPAGWCHYVPVPLCVSATMFQCHYVPMPPSLAWKLVHLRQVWKMEKSGVLSSNFFVVNVCPKAFSCVGRGILKNNEVR